MIKTFLKSLVLIVLSLAVLLSLASILESHTNKFRTLIIFGDSGLIIRAASKIVNNGISTLTGLVTFGANIVSDTDGTDDVGTTSVRWDQVYADELFANKGADVASIASAFTLGADGNYYDITGTTGIDSIAAQTVGKVVVLQFDDAVTVTDGGNLKLEGNFVSVAGATLMLQSDGTDWYEVSRAGAGIFIAGAATITGAQTFTGLTTHGGNVISDTDGTDNLGSSSVFWSAIFADQAIFQKGGDIASAASDFAVGADGTLFDVTGNTGIDSIAVSTTGRIIILQFDSTPTLTDGGNLKLAGNFTAGADDIMILVASGNFWHEISRSVN